MHVLAPPRWVYLLGFPILGLGAGWLLKKVAGVLPGVFKLAALVPEPYRTVGAFALGAAAGLVVAFLALLDSTTVTVSDAGVTLRRGDATTSVGRAAIAAVFLDGGDLVVLGRDGDELARERYDLGARRVADAFTAHGLPWKVDGDPYRDAYRRWVEDTPDLPAGANAVLKARAKALAKGDREDASQLRTELGKLGLVIRDEQKRQFWRATIGR